MSAVGVAFRNGSPHSKLHVLQETTNNVNMSPKSEKRDIVLVRKKQKINEPPQSISVSAIINQSPTVTPQKAKKQIKTKDYTRVHNPPPIAVARRNARERNRVKQVNNGFANLRQHIPNEIAEIYENANNSRAANKKLSKVETLRMAVEYIRSLENILSLDVSRDSKENGSNLSMSSFPSPASSESLQNNSYEQGYFSLQSPILDDEYSDPPTPLPPVSSHHYSRIPGTNAFQLIPGPPPLNYEDEENIHPLTPNSDLINQEDLIISSNMLNTNMEFIQAQGSEFTVIHPGIYSTLPNENIDLIKYMPNQILYQNIHNQDGLDKFERIKSPKTEEACHSGDKIFIGESVLKQEPEEVEFHKDDTDDSMEDVIKWWETEGRHEDQ